MSEVQRLYILLCGYEIIPKAISVRGADERFILSEPVCAYLLKTFYGWVLLDTGIDPLHITNPVRQQAYFTMHGMLPPIVRKQHHLERQLSQIGIQLSDIPWIILSHLHFDHTGYLKYCPHARVSVQKREYDEARNSTCLGYIKEDFTSPSIQWDFHEGDWDAFPGLTLLETSGHTPGHQSALIQLPKTGPFILTFDAGDLRENFEHTRPPGSVTDEVNALKSIQRLNALASELNAKIILFHDPNEIQNVRLFPDYYA
ncbi:N-acyl homoserine lactonase family protein [Gluconobacter cerinus]|uniref:N-acyl homoserine lactonase family protein n=1 Tax=Gluconobacter cerinus TaxID=38307 RepID=UPI001B8B56DE|nr:N-acyl homoserine lactonase family protein [Gluconobacter cerinus]MBS1072481.1 N-acyl homoserine lactonase family protein [Gluconobacter cerinus]